VFASQCGQKGPKYKVFGRGWGGIVRAIIGTVGIYMYCNPLQNFPGGGVILFFQAEYEWRKSIRLTGDS